MGRCNRSENYRGRQLGGPYRSRNGLLFGVCAGFAEHLDFSVFWTRVIVLITFICTGIWPVGVAYLIAALLMKPAPVLAFADESEAEFYGSYTSSRKMAAQRVKRTQEGLDRRIQRLEGLVTSKEFDWDGRMNQA